MLFKSLKIALFVCVVAMCGPVLADEYATPAEAQAIVDRAIVYYDQVGRDAALKEFSNKQGKFTDRDLYVFVGTLEGVFLAHINPGLIGKNLNTLKDVNGKLIGAEIVNSAQSHPEGGWVEYTWTHPGTKKLAPKRTWVKVHDGLFFAAGAYESK